MQQWLPIIAIASALCSAACAVVAWRLDSACTRAPKRKPSPDPTQPSDASALAQMAADQAALFSTLEKLTTTVKRLSSRQGMRELRDREAEDAAAPPPPGTSKAALLRYYGLSGKVGPEFARKQMELDRGSN